MKIGNRDFNTKDKTYIMGILNVTPDSFSDGGCFNSPDAAFYQTEKMIKEGADIIDVGGESTRPGYTKISDEEEMQRIGPVIRGIKERFEIPVSADTYKSSVAAAAIAAGADLINDIWGLQYDGTMAEVIAKSGAACCLMHNRKSTAYKDFFSDMKSDLSETISLAKAAGIADDKIILDPGIGFAKTYEQNLLAIRRTGELHTLGYPLLLGVSRKSVIGLALNLPVSERIEGTLAVSVLAVERKCMFLRVHDVKENVRAVRMAEHILYG